MNVYEIVTDRMIKQLEQGVIPWKKCWQSSSQYAYNRKTKRVYSFLNQMLLSKHGEYASFKQWKELGGTIKKGEKGEQVVFWTFLEKEEEKENGTKEKKRIPILKYYTVFHVSQVEGVEPLEKTEVLPLFERIENAEEVKKSYLDRENIKIEESDYTEACYIPGLDKICVPKGERFTKNEEYYSTLFHEMVHSTGHEKRLNRDIRNKFGSQKYATEELVAEMGSAIILNQLNIETDATFKNSAAYVKSWLGHLTNDPKLVVIAAGRAEKAVKFIEGVKESNCVLQKEE